MFKCVTSIGISCDRIDTDTGVFLFVSTVIFDDSSTEYCLCGRILLSEKQIYPFFFTVSIYEIVSVLHKFFMLKLLDFSQGCMTFIF